ncbi:Structural maintenance of chromosomes protein [Aphelenchoides fujianensis]|nr:Structural maintenance of chromosomes protein [Aphelenchoides fujianensis]
MSLKSLEITDFKSFKGTHLIGPLHKFTAIQLIHGASIGQPVSTRCRVQMNFVEAGGRLRKFSRAIVSSTTSEYRVDDAIVTPAEYQHALQAINLFIRARNFLVYQGAVEQVAMQSPRDLTAMIEELSRSAELKADYERLKAEMVRADVDAQENMAKRRDVAAEKKEARAEKELARNYQTVRDDLAAKNRDLFLAQLFVVEHARDKLQEHLDTLQGEADAVRQRRAEQGRQSTDTQQAVRQHARELGKMEGKLTKENKKVADQRTICAQTRKEVEHLKTKLDGAKKVVKAAKKKADEHRGRLLEAERALSEAQKQKEELSARRLQESQQQKLNLDHEQLAEYRRLKTVAAKQTSVVDGVLYNLQQAQTTDEAVVEHEKRKLDECNERIREFACGNALVADSADEARRLAYGVDRHRAVALDGTQFQPNGVISGGGSDLKARAKRWDEQHLRKLKDEQRVLREQLHALQTTSKRELDLAMKRRQIQSLESRVRYTQLEIKSHGEQLRQLELKLEEFKAALDNIQPRIEDKEEAMRERAATIAREEAKRSGVEDAVFADFCARIGVAHIRVYEEREVHFQQESERQLAECDAELSRLENELEYLRAEDREAAIQREKDAIRKLERDLAAGEQRLQAEDARLAELEAHVEALKAEQAAKQKFQLSQNHSAQAIIVISLKDELFANSDALLGVYPQAVDPCINSGVLSLDLSQLAVS